MYNWKIKYVNKLLELFNISEARLSKSELVKSAAEAHVEHVKKIYAKYGELKGTAVHNALNDHREFHAIAKKRNNATDADYDRQVVLSKRMDDNAHLLKLAHDAL